MSRLRRNLKSPASGREIVLHLCMMRAACQAQSLEGPCVDYYMIRFETAHSLF